MAKSLSDSQKKNLEKKYLTVDSEHFELLHYAIDRKGKGMHIVYKDQRIPLAPEDIDTFITEIKEVWNHMGVKV